MPIFQPDTFAIAFNKPLWQGSATAANFQILAAPSYSVVSSVAAYSPSTDTVYLTPTGTLNPGTTYVIRVAAAVSDDQGFSVADTKAGGTLGTVYYNSFTITQSAGRAGSSSLEGGRRDERQPRDLARQRPALGPAVGLRLGHVHRTGQPVALGLHAGSRRCSTRARRARTATPLLTNVPLNATLAFNPNTNQLIIVPTQVDGERHFTSSR